jgi:hypothetical protein
LAFKLKEGRSSNAVENEMSARRSGSLIPHEPKNLGTIQFPLNKSIPFVLITKIVKWCEKEK